MRKLFRFVLLVTFVLAVGAVLAGSVMGGRLHEPFKGYTASEQFVEIPSGAGTNDIGRRLVEGGVVSNVLVFRAAVWSTGRVRALKAGEYRFTEPMSAAQVVDKLARGDVYVRRITFPEGLTILDMAKIYEARGFGPAADFVRAASDALQTQARAQGLTTRQVVTIASLVEKETAQDAERPLVAAVYRNRLKIG